MSRSKRRLSLATSGAKIVAPYDGNMSTYSLRSDRRAPSDDVVMEVPIDIIDPSPWQHRLVFVESELRSMADSFGPDGSGLLQPPTVRLKQDGRYELVAGERRLRAAKMVPLTRLRVLVRELDDRAARIAGAMENIERDSLSPYELSCAMLGAVEAYREDGGRTNAGAGSIAREWGLSRPVVSEHLAVARSITRDMLVSAGAVNSFGVLDPLVIQGLSLAALKRAAKATSESTRIARLRDGIVAIRRRAATRARGSDPQSDDADEDLALPRQPASEAEGGEGEQGAAAGGGATAEQGFRKQIRKAIEAMSAEEAERHLQDLVPVVTRLVLRLDTADDSVRVLRDAKEGILLVACGPRSRVARELGVAVPLSKATC